MTDANGPGHRPGRQIPGDPGHPPDGAEPDGAGNRPTEDADGDPPLDPPPLRGSVGLRVAVYFLSVILAISVAASEILRHLDGPEAVRAMSEPGAEIEPMLFLWLRLLTLPIVLAVTVFFVRRLDHGRLRDIGLQAPPGTGIHLLLSCFIAAAPLIGWFLLVDPWATSKLENFSGEELQLDPWLPLDAAGLLWIVAAFIGLAFLDEIIFRGYVYSAFRERFSWVHAAGLANVLSISLYASHPDIGAAGLINAFLLGLALAAMRERTGSLLMPAVFLGMWNVILGCGLSLPVSGTYFPRLYDHRLEGPAAVTGGEFGPEGSWLLTVFLLALVMLLAAWVERGGRGHELELVNRP
ncbi:MAG: lysostaphin resistance A-like protein [Acidobacteriota bacterium]